MHDYFLNRFSSLATFTMVAATLAISPVQAAQITVVPWLAPNVFGSPSFPGAQANAVQAMYNNVSSFGTPGGPTFFQASPNVTSAQAVVTGFPSWLGQVNPGTVFGPAFANEYGNRMTFALRIDGLDAAFSISQLSFNAVSSDPGNTLAFGYAAGAYDYSSAYVGVLKGDNGILWDSDDIFVTSGPNTQLVDGLVGRGSGNSLPAACIGCTPEQQQAALDAVAASLGQSVKFTGTYSLGDSSGSATFNLEQTPLPAAAWLFGTVLASGGIAGWRRRKSARRAGLA